MTQKGPPPVIYDRPSVDLEPLFSAAGHLTGTDPMLLKAIAMRESSLNPGNWTPSTRAVGLMSLEPQNWKSLGVTDPWDPAQNITGGALLLRDNLKMYDGDLNKALQQYNGGNPSRWGAATRSYAQDVLNNYKKLTGQQAPDILPQFIKPPPPPVLRPAAAAMPAPPVHLNMNTDPSAGPDFAQNQPDPLAMPPTPGDPAASQASVQPALALASRGSAPQPSLRPTQPPSPFVQAFLTNAIFGRSVPPYPFGIGTGIRPGGPGGR
jgi:hypothetical protein